MKLKELKEYLKSKAKEIEEEYLCNLKSIDYFKTIKNRKAYHFTITFKLKGNEEIYSEIFNISIKEVNPHVNFDFDLDYYTDKKIKFTIDDTFKRFGLWLWKTKNQYQEYRDVSGEKGKHVI